MADNQESRTAEPAREHDPGLKRLLTYTFITLVLAVVAAFVAMSLAVHFFDSP